MKPKTRADVVIFEGNYPAWPWVIRDSQDRLLCGFREDGLADRKEGGHHYSPVGRAMLTISDDNVKTWSSPTIAIDNPNYDDTGLSIVELPDRSLLASYGSRLSDSRYCQAWVTSSLDGGQTWLPSIKISVHQNTLVRGAPVPLSNGDILVPIYGSTHSRLGDVSMTAISSDGGKTWAEGYIPNTTSGKLNEWVALEVEPGRLIGLHRDEHEHTLGFFWQTESQDWGRTWTKPVQTNVRSTVSASPPHLGIHGAKVVLTYSDARMHSVSMVTAADQNYSRWDIENRVACYQYRSDGKRIADASYPCSVPTGPHQRLVVDYEIESSSESEWLAALPINHRPLAAARDYSIDKERKQITGHFVDTPMEWGTA